MWQSLRGPLTRLYGTAGTAVLPIGSVVIQIHAYPQSGGGTVQIFDDAAALTLPGGSWWYYRTNHTVLKAIQGNTNIVFTTTISYMVEYMVRP